MMPSFSTIWRTMDWARAGSPPSSARMIRTRCPLRPPRLFTSAIQARMAGGAADEIVPSGPLSTPKDPKTISLLGPVAAGFALVGPDGSPACDGVDGDAPPGDCAAAPVTGPTGAEGANERGREPRSAGAEGACAVTGGVPETELPRGATVMLCDAGRVSAVSMLPLGAGADSDLASVAASTGRPRAAKRSSRLVTFPQAVTTSATLTVETSIPMTRWPN